MDIESLPEVVDNDVVVSLACTLTVNGEEVESYNETDPLEFIQGSGFLVPGLEQQLYGMKIGERKQVVVSPEEGYGEIDPEALAYIPRSEFPEEIPLEVGVDLDITDDDGDVLSATIVAVDNSTVRLDFNPPYAGQSLYFEVRVLALRLPTAEELEHGHVHSEDGEDEEDEDFHD